MVFAVPALCEVADRDGGLLWPTDSFLNRASRRASVIWRRMWLPSLSLRKMYSL